MDEGENLSSTEDVQASGEDSQASFSLLHPPKIGRYTILRRLGKGGFGEIFLAFDDDLDRPVAIKVPRPERVSCPEDIEAYLNEARIVASLDHPHIVPVYDVGRTEDGQVFVVSKFIEGSDLKAKIEQARPSFHESAELVATVAEALHYAHTRGLVHRDIKPANILIDSKGKPCVADFGLALRVEDLGKGPRFAGTVAYMSPEQARHEAHLLDGRSDIFSLGVVFYELLTGITPFRGCDWLEVAERIMTLEARPPRQVDDTIPHEMERICLKAVSKRTTDRYTTALDLANDLRSFLQSIGDSEGAAAQPRRKDELSGRDSVVRLDGFSFQRTLGPNLYLATEQRSGELVEILAIEESRFYYGQEALHRKFMSDAYATCRIDHPYIRKLLSVIEKNEIVHLVREHCGVRSVRDDVISSRNSMSLSEMRDLLVKIAEGLCFSHSHQLVHGNLTPMDIMIDVSGNPKIAFPNCQFLGTPYYVAPELFESSDYDGRADIWSFGIIMFEMLTGGTRPFPPFRLDASRKPSGREPVPLRQIDNTLPRELERICSRCLSKEVGERYSSASDLAEDLRHCQLNRPSLWRWFRPNRGD